MEEKLCNFKFRHYGARKRKEDIIKSIVDIGKEYRRPLRFVQKP